MTSRDRVPGAFEESERTLQAKAGGGTAQYSVQGLKVEKIRADPDYVPVPSSREFAPTTQQAS
jgi:hypothetical protein